MPTKLTKQNFEQFIKAKKIILVDFFATWCGPCLMLSPIIDQIEKEVPDILVGKVDVDQESELADKFEISGVPTLILFSEGKILDQRVGFVPKNELIKWIEEYKK
ncbi:MAG: thioredoxin [Candidatus Micrarchaeota archaeon]|nr:thioredoxin [Candidatus Micrarchaeota archaeon]